jgi:amino acid transporter
VRRGSPALLGPFSPVSAVLARERIGAPMVAAFVVASMGPFLVTAGLVPTAYATASLTGVPAMFLVVAIVLAVFSVGYVAMGQRIRNAGAFYAYIARGLGRPVGVGAAFVAVIGYNLMQVSIYGAIGTSAASFFADNGGARHTWWVWALAAWVLVTVLGLAQVRVSSALLGVLSAGEILIALALSIKGLAHPAGGRIDVTALSPLSLRLGPTLGGLIGVTVLAYIGFEQAVVYTEEARNPRGTILRATFLCLAGLAIVYALASWAMDVYYGAATVSVAQQQGSLMLFGMAPGLLASAGRCLYLTALLAALIAFHNASWRYMYSLARERVLPYALARTASGIPRGASLVQSAAGLAAIGLAVGLHWDPMNQLFYWASTTGGFGILLLLALTSIATVVFFARQPAAERAAVPVWQRTLAPAMAALALGFMAYLCTVNFSALLGVPDGSLAALFLPAVFPTSFLLGLGVAVVLRAARPEVYARIGLGAESDLALVAPAAIPPAANAEGTA